MKNNIYSPFTNLYSLSKTLKFSLIPVGATQAHIVRKGLITQDEERALNYQSMKKSIDAYHREHISTYLKNIELSRLEEYQEQYNKNTNDQDKAIAAKKKEERKSALKDIQALIRKQVVAKLTTGDAKEAYANIFKKELITQCLEPFVNEYNEKAKKDDALDAFVPDFKRFTTYFSGFHENRKNMYSDKEQSTAIAYRIVHENLPKYIDNLNILDKIQQQHPQLQQQINAAMNEMVEGANIDWYFKLNGFNHVCEQQGIDHYNGFVGGHTNEKQQKIQGINETINLYNQSNQLKGVKKVPKLKPLYKQILSDRHSSSFLLEKFENDIDIKEAISQYYTANLESVEIDATFINVLDEIEKLTIEINEYDQSKIYIQANERKKISNRLYGQYGVIEAALGYHYSTQVDQTFESQMAKANENKKDALYKKKENQLNQPYSMQFIQNCINDYIETLDESDNLRKNNEPNQLLHYFNEYNFTENLSKNPDKIISYTANVKAKYSCIKGLLAKENKDNDRALLSDTEETYAIKAFLESLMELLHFIKPLNVSLDEKDEAFYGQFLPYYDELALIIPLYNKCRNYLTQKPYSLDKIKLNFENSTLLNGWDRNKERDNGGVLLCKDNQYYLAIMPKGHNKSFTEIPRGFKADKNAQYYQKMEYKLLPGANKMLPKVFLSKKGIDTYFPSDELLDGYKKGMHKKGDNFNMDFMHQLIDYFKNAIAKHPDWKHFEHQFSPTKTYQDLSPFYKEVEQQGYKITFKELSEAYIDHLVDEGKLYLFQIYNKDFSKKSKSKSDQRTDNLFTIYWKSLFDPQNLNDVIYKLNGEAEVFHRKASIDINKAIVHPKEEPVKTKNLNNQGKEKIFPYDIIKDKRFTKDTFHFHVPITMNFKAQGNSYINHNVLSAIKEQGEVNVIGIDRGERNLLCASVINAKGEILEHVNFNKINYKVGDQERKVDYHQLLTKKQGERDKARKDWGVIENIKELKAGYLSIVVHEVALLMLKYKAIVVLEDLNFGFKRGRFKFEKQVYQKFEKALIDKLNYLIIKGTSDDELAGRFKALQLTSQFESFQKLGKQSGFLFYVPAWNTSKIDPATGFVDLLKPRYENAIQAKAFFEKFDNMGYNAKKDYFEFSFNYSNFHNKAQDTKTHWTVCSHGKTRYIYKKALNNNRGGYETINVTFAIKELLDAHQISYSNNENLVDAISDKNSAALYRELMRYLQVLLAMRYSIVKYDENKNITHEEDFILSPVANAQGEFYDSNKYKEAYEKNNSAELPIDADDNGAFNIGRKGSWIIQKINDFDEADDNGNWNWKKFNHAISNKEWLQFIQTDD